MVLEATPKISVANTGETRHCAKGEKIYHFRFGEIIELIALDCFQKSDGIP